MTVSSPIVNTAFASLLSVSRAHHQSSHNCEHTINRDQENVSLTQGETQEGRAGEKVDLGKILAPPNEFGGGTSSLNPIKNNTTRPNTRNNMPNKIISENITCFLVRGPDSRSACRVLGWV